MRKIDPAAWLPIPGFPPYEIRADGRIRKPSKTTEDGYRYLTVRIFKDHHIFGGRTNSREGETMNRKQRREMKKLTPEAWLSMVEVERQEGFYEGQGQILTLVLAFLHIDKGYKRKNMREWLKQFDSFAVSVNGYGKGSLAELKQILLDECEFDIDKEFAELLPSRKPDPFEEVAKNE